VVLLLVFGLLLPAVAAAAERQATLSSDPVPLAAGVRIDRLIESTLGPLDLPPTVNTLALARVTLRPGATARAYDGAHQFVVEAGVLTVQDQAHMPPPPPGTPGVHQDVPVGPAVTHGAGEQFFVAHSGVYPPATITNEGEEEAVALMVSISITGGAGLAGLLTGWDVVEPLAVADAADVSLPMSEALGLDAEPFAVALDRVSYDRGATLDFIWVDSAGRLFAVESGALNVLAIDPAIYEAAGDGPKRLQATTRVSPLPGDLLFVPAPGRIATRNVERGPSTVLIVTVGAAVPAS
jgi:hypothetical protein